jgi:hypothetical protein
MAEILAIQDAYMDVGVDTKSRRFRRCPEQIVEQLQVLHRYAFL